jgi:hypothetical protein
MPAAIASLTSVFAWSRSISGRKPFSNTAIAASDPDPIVTYGSESVDPCGWMEYSAGPLTSTPPSTRAADTCPWYLYRCCFNRRHAVFTRDWVCVCERERKRGRERERERESVCVCV